MGSWEFLNGKTNLNLGKKKAWFGYKRKGSSMFQGSSHTQEINLGVFSFKVIPQFKDFLPNYKLISCFILGL